MQRKIPIGIDSFSQLVDKDKNYLFVDKSLMIKELMDSGAQVSLILRPRRWGKTLNMSMLQHFFAPTVNGQSTQGLFDNLKIAHEQNGFYIKKYHRKYPVIFMSFKDTKKDNFNSFIEKVKILIQEICNRYPELEHSKKLLKSEQDNFKKLMFKDLNRSELSNALKTLSGLLSKHYESKVFIFIDEYDTPLNAAYGQSYFDDLVNFFKELLGTALKGNDALEKGVITGILRLSKNKMLSDLNNLKLYSLIEEQYSQCFGFSEEEVKALFKEQNINLDLKDIRYWYNGYNAGSLESIYNPWSVLNCIEDKGNLKPYWIKTGNEDILKSIFENANKELESKMVQLLEGIPIETKIDEYISFDQIKERGEEVLWSLLWATGYLKFSKKPEISTTGSYVGPLEIPNYETTCSYRAVFPKWIRSLNKNKYDSFLNNLISGNIDSFAKDLKEYLLNIPSWFDFTSESEYHSFLLGLTSSLSDTHEILSNREIALGKPDIVLIPKNSHNHLGVVIEFKRAQDNPLKDIHIYKKIATEGLQQINQKKYDQNLRSTPHIKEILKLCIVFYGKEFVYESTLEKK